MSVPVFKNFINSIIHYICKNGLKLIINDIKQNSCFDKEIILINLKNKIKNNKELEEKCKIMYNTIQKRKK